MSWFWTAFWARLGWEVVPIAIVLVAFALVFAAIAGVALWGDISRRTKRLFRS